MLDNLIIIINNNNIIIGNIVWCYFAYTVRRVKKYFKRNKLFAVSSV